MKLKIGVDEQTHIMHDLEADDDFGVKIRVPCNRNPIILQKGEDDSTPMCAKGFLDLVEQSKKEKTDITIVVQEDMDSDKQKAWICDCEEDCNHVENVTCIADRQNNVVLLSFV